MTQIIFYAILAISTTLVVAVLTKGQHTLRKTVLSAGCGICSLGTINLLSSITGIAITVNYTTCFIAAVLSIPGVALMFVLELLFAS